MWIQRTRSSWPQDTHSDNLNEKVHKPQSKSYCRIGANMQLIFTHTYLMNLTHIDALNPFSSKLITLTLRGGL